MKRKIQLRTKLTGIVSMILMISNTILVMLLFYNFKMSLSGFSVPIEGGWVEISSADGLEEKILLLGICVDVIATFIGTMVTYIVLGRMLDPLQQLTLHMENVKNENAVESVSMDSPIAEIDSLIQSFNRMILKINEMIETQKGLSSYIAHELRTPLAVMQTKIDVYHKQTDRNPEEVVELCSGQISRLSQMVTQILNLVRIQNIEKKECIPLYILLEEICDELEEYAEEKEVTLKLEKDFEKSSEEYLILGDYALLYQAFFNVIQNGIKYNRSGGTVQVCLTEVSDAVQIQVQDDGPGITKQEKEKIFQPFYRCKGKRVQEIEGTGIGLALAKQIFTQHNGTITAAEQDQGSCFEIILEKE